MYQITKNIKYVENFNSFPRLICLFQKYEIENLKENFVFFLTSYVNKYKYF